MNNTQFQNMNTLVGTLNIFIGPMYAGKSTKLISIYEKNTNVLVLTHSIENRYSDKELSTHNLVKIPCIKSDSIKNFICNYKTQINQSNIILIDEAQFFKDIRKTLDLVEIFKKKVFIFGLDGDFERQQFGNILDLIPLCDTVEKLQAICKVCNNSAIFSHRIIPQKEQIVIGSTDIYIPLCRKCYLEKTINKTI
jgi:thymidine kinase